MARTRARDLILMTPKGVFMSVDMKCGLDDPQLISKKELAYPGTFVKVDEDGETQFELPVDESQLDHWVRTFDQMRSDGIDVPVPVGHDTSPEVRRGTVIKMAVEPSQHPSRLGKPALFCYIRWRKPEFKQDYADSDVSLFMPHQFTSGLGKTYHRPIRHVAITDYPVVPSLSKFSDIAAAFELSFIACDQEEGNTMASPVLTALCQRLGIECPEGADDEAISQSIEEAFNSAPGGGGEGGVPPGEGDDEIPPDDGEEFSESEGMGAGAPPEVFDDEGEEEPHRNGRDRNYEPPPSMGFDVPRSLQTRLVKTRQSELKQLVNDKKISPAVAKQLTTKYCTEKAVSFALSHEVMYPGETGDDFDDLIVALSLNSPIASTGEKTGHQASANHGGNGTPSIVKDAEARAAKHNARHRRLQ